MKTINLMIAFAATVMLFSCSNNKQPENSPPPAEEKEMVGGQAMINDDDSEKNIVQVAASSADHTTLVAAVQAAGLVNVLANNGPLTVFAPTNEAFAALPEGTVEELLKPENKIKLMKIIHYHAAPGTYMDDLLKNDMDLYMATGDDAKIMVSEDGKVTVNGANILATIKASNGVVHVIDKVIFAPEKK
jgi:uncharacterized surface protein with fasciclin (FAS1) repeats